MKNQDLPLAQPVEHVEKRQIERLTPQKLLRELVVVFTLERGGLWTLKWLLLNPGKLVRAYLGTERYRVTSPLKLLTITTAIALYVSLYYDMNDTVVSSLLNETELAGSIDAISQVFDDYFNILFWIGIPLNALFTFLLLRGRLNYVEHIVVFSYFACIMNIFYLILTPFLLNSTVQAVYSVLIAGYFVYLYAVAIRFTRWYQYPLSLLIFFVGNYFHLSIMLSLSVFITKL